MDFKKCGYQDRSHVIHPARQESYRSLRFSLLQKVAALDTWLSELPNIVYLELFQEKNETKRNRFLVRKLEKSRELSNRRHLTIFYVNLQGTLLTQDTLVNLLQIMKTFSVHFAFLFRQCKLASAAVSKFFHLARHPRTCFIDLKESGLKSLLETCDSWKRVCNKLVT